MLKEAPLNFAGNVEARDLPLGKCDVVVCDGAEVSRASLHNINIMYDTLHTPFKGQKIYVSKRNMIIPKIERAKDENDQWI